MCMISVHLTGKPGTTRFLVAQRVEGNGVLRNEVPKQERPCLQWQRVDSHRAFCDLSLERTSKRLRRLDAAHVERREGPSGPSRIRAQRDDELVQLVERLAHPIRAPDASVESLLRGIEVMQGQ